MKSIHEYFTKTTLNNLSNLDISNITDLINKDKLRILLNLISEEIKITHKTSIDLNFKLFLVDVDPKFMVNVQNNKATFLHIQINSDEDVLFPHFKQEKYHLQTILEDFNNYNESMLDTIASKPFGQIITGNCFIEYDSYVQFHKIVYKMKSLLDFEEDFIDLFKEIVPNSTNFYYKNYRLETCFIETRFNFVIKNYFKNKLVSFEFKNNEVIFIFDRNHIVMTIEDFFKYDKSSLYFFIEKVLNFTGTFDGSFNDFINEIKLESVLKY